MTEAIITVGAKLAGNTRQAFKTIATGMKDVAKAMSDTAVDMKKLGQSANSKNFERLANTFNKLANEVDKHSASAKKAEQSYRALSDAEGKLSQSLQQRIAQLKSAMSVGKASLVEQKRTKAELRAMQVQYHALFASTSKYGEVATKLGAHYKKTSNDVKGVRAALQQLNKEFTQSAGFQQKQADGLRLLNQQYSALRLSTDRYGAAAKATIRAFEKQRLTQQEAARTLKVLQNLQNGSIASASKHNASIKKIRQGYVGLISSGTKFGTVAREIVSRLEQGTLSYRKTNGILKQLEVNYKRVTGAAVSLTKLETTYKTLLTSTDKFGKSARGMVKDVKAGSKSVEDLTRELKELDAAQKEMIANSKSLQKLRVQYAGLRKSTDRYGVAAKKMIENHKRGLITIAQLRSGLGFLAKKQREAGLATKKSSAEFASAQRMAGKLQVRYLQLAQSGGKYAAMSKRIIANLKAQTISASQAAKQLALVNQAQLKSISPLVEGYRRLGRSIKTYASYMAASSVIFGVIQGFRNMTKTVIDYHQALKDLQAITKATDAEVDRMGDTIKQVASDTKFSATETAEGMKKIGQAGFTASEAINMIGATADLATGTLTEMDTVVDLMTTSLRVFGLQSIDSAHVADVFANAVNRSKLTIDKIRIAMNYIGPVAAAAGVSLEETAGAMMLLANQGIRASTIGTGLRQVFRRLVDPSKQMTIAMQAAGIAMEDLNPAGGNLWKVMDKLSEIVKTNEDAFQMFGQRGATAVLAFIDRGGKGMKDMLAIVEQQGSAADMAAIQMEGLGVSFKNLADKIKNLYIAMGEGGLAGALKLFVDSARGVVDLFTGVFSNSLVQFTSKWVLATAAAHGFVVVLRLLKNSAIGQAFFAPLTAGITAYTTATLTATTATSRFITVLKVGSAVVARFLPAAALMGVVMLIQKLTMADEKTQEFIRTMKQEKTQVDQQIEGLNAFIYTMKHFNGTASEKNELMKRLALAYPELAKQILNTKGNMDELTPVLEKHIKQLQALADLKLQAQGKSQFKLLKDEMEHLRDLRSGGMSLSLSEMFMNDEEMKLAMATSRAEINRFLSVLSNDFKEFKKNNPDATIETFVNAQGIRDKHVVKRIRQVYEASLVAFEEHIALLQEKHDLTRAEAMERANASPESLKSDYAKQTKELKGILTEQLFEIELAEAKGLKTSEEAASEKLRISREAADAQLAIAKDYHSRMMDTGDEAGTDIALGKRIAAEEKVYAIRLQQLQAFAQAKKANSAKLLAIDKALEDKRLDLIKKRVDAEKKADADILGLKQSLEEKLLKIAQRGMTDEQVEATNEEFARQQFAEAIRQANKAKREGDKAGLAASTALFEKAEGYYDGLADSGKAANGLKKINAELIKNRETLRDMDVGAIDAELSKEERKAKAKRDAVKTGLHGELEDFSTHEDMKLSKAKEIIESRKLGEKTRHDSEMTHIEAETNAIVKKGEAAKAAAATPATGDPNARSGVSPAAATTGDPNARSGVSPAAAANIGKDVEQEVNDAVKAGVEKAVANGAFVTPLSEFDSVISDEVSQGVQGGLFDGVQVEGMPLEEWKKSGKKQGKVVGEAMAEEAAMALNGFFVEENEEGLPIDVRIGDPGDEDLDTYTTRIQEHLDRYPGEPTVDFTDAEAMIAAFVRNAQNKYRITLPVTTSAPGQNRADGGPVYAMNDGGRLPGQDSLYDKLKVMARPGEWFIKNESVKHWKNQVGDWFMPGVNKPKSRAGQALQGALSSGQSASGGGSGSMKGMASLGKIDITMGGRKTQIAATPNNAKSLLLMLKDMEAMAS